MAITKKATATTKKKSSTPVPKKRTTPTKKLPAKKKTASTWMTTKEDGKYTRLMKPVNPLYADDDTYYQDMPDDHKPGNDNKRFRVVR